MNDDRINVQKAVLPSVRVTLRICRQQHHTASVVTTKFLKKAPSLYRDRAHLLSSENHAHRGRGNIHPSIHPTSVANYVQWKVVKTLLEK